MSRRSASDIKLDKIRAELSAEAVELRGSITELQARLRVVDEMLVRLGDAPASKPKGKSAEGSLL